MRQLLDSLYSCVPHLVRDLDKNKVHKLSRGSVINTEHNHLVAFLFLIFVSMPLTAKSADDFIQEVEDLQYQQTAPVVSTVASYAQAPYKPADQGMTMMAPPPNLPAGTEIMNQQLAATVQRLTGKIERLERRLAQLEEKTGHPVVPGGTERLTPEAQVTPSQTARDATVKTLGTISADTVKQSTASYPEGAKALYEHAYSLMTSHDLMGAQEAFKTFVERYPSHELAGAANYWWGDIYYAEKQYDKAAKKFLVGYQNYKSSPKAPDMLLKLGMTLDQLGEKSKACTTLRKLRAEYPNASSQLLQHATNIQQKLKCPG